MRVLLLIEDSVNQLTTAILLSFTDSQYRLWLFFYLFDTYHIDYTFAASKIPQVKPLLDAELALSAL